MFLFYNFFISVLDKHALLRRLSVQLSALQVVPVGMVIVSRDAVDACASADGQFHQTIYALCGSHSMQDTLEPLHRKLLKYRRVSVSAQSRAQKSLDEHRAIYEAIAAHDGEKAEKLTIAHVQNARDSILKRVIMQ